MHRLPWFCLWNDARTDKKLGALADDEFRVWFNLLCFAAEQPERGTIPAIDPYVLAVEVAYSDGELLERTIARLVALGIVERRAGGIAFRDRAPFTPRRFARAARATPEYRRWRAAVLARDGYACRACGATAPLQAHHLLPFARYPEARYDVSNGVTLCAPCHRQEHTGGKV